MQPIKPFRPLLHALLGLLSAASLPMALALDELAPEVAETCNLVKNGQFEEGARLPTGWARYPAKDTNGNYHLRDTNVFHTGHASGLINNVAPQPPGTAAMQWSQYKVPVEGGSTLMVSLYAKSDGVPVHGGGVHMYDEKGGHLGFESIPGPPTPARQWTHLFKQVPLPAEARSIGFVAYTSTGGKTWYDDLAVLGTPSTAASRATPRLDGKLDEPCWNEARAIKTFVAHTGKRIIAEPVRAWVAYDDTALYVAFRCPFSPGAALRDRATAHDGDTWLDDSIEVFLDPRHQHQDYFQFCVNCRGIVRDAHGRDKTWESGARAVAGREPAAWTVELAIPFEQLGLSLDAGHAWGLNLVWNNRQRAETATWSLGGFHQPGRFGNVTLAPDLSRFFRPELAQRLASLALSRQTVLQELETADLPKAGREQSQRALTQARARLDSLRPFTRADAPLPQGGWDTIRRDIAEAATNLAAARTGALRALYDADTPGGKDSFRVVPAHALQKVPRSGPVNGGRFARQVQLEAARDEAESFQLVVVPNGTALKQVSVEAAPLTGPGRPLSLAWHRVGYVQTDTPGYPTEYVGWWPDPLLPASAFDVPADERQPLWFTVNVPPDAQPGVYQGAVTLRCGAESHAIPVTLRVRNFRLPRPGTLAVPFSLYQSTWAKWWFGKEPEKMPMETFTRWCEFIAQYRLTPKNIGREYIAKTGEGARVRVDLGNLKQTVLPLAAKYFPPFSFNLCRLPSGVSIGKAPGTTNPDDAATYVKTWVDAWHLQALPNQVYLYGYDEARPDQYPFLCEAYRRIRQVAPDYPIMQTLNDPQPQALAGLVGIWCPLTPSLASDFYARRRQAGDTLWTYVCCSPKPPYANFFVDEPAIDHRILFWQARQYGATGVLYWSTACWDGIPSTASGKPHFPDVPIRVSDLSIYKKTKVNGDGLLLYPGKDMTPLPSIRLEVIRDGIEDYECLALLARLVAQAKSLPRAQQPDTALLNRAAQLCLVPDTISRRLTDYTKNPDTLFARRSQINEAIESLATALK